MAVQEAASLISRPIDGAPFGRVVELGRRPHELDSATADELRRLLADHHVLLFQGELTEAEHVRLISCFGRVLPQGPRVIVNDHTEGPFPIVTFVSNDAERGSLGTFELAFHHDLGHVPTPLGGISLHAIDVAEGQSATRFANGRLAYLDLPAATQERLEGLQSMFSANYTATTTTTATARDLRDQLDPTWPRAVHPVVAPHPVNGERCVFINEMMTVNILGLSQAESDELLDMLFERLYDPANIYEHHWQTGDLVVWDNLVVQHARAQLDRDLPRTLRRVVFGEKVPWEEWPFRAGD